MIEVFVEFLRYEKRASAHTILAYQTDLDQLKKYLLFQYDAESLEGAQPAMLRSWVVSLMEEHVAPSSINRKIATLRSFYAFLRKKRLISKDPTKVLLSLKAGKKLPMFVEEKSIEMLFDEIGFTDDYSGLRDQVVLEILYGTGMRLAELLGLTVSDINPYSNTIKVLGKGSKERIIPISTLLSDLLKKYLSQRAPEEATQMLILTDKGKEAYPMFIQRIVKKYLTAVTTLSQKSPHILRHTYATHLLNRGAELNAIKDLLGHANLAATQIYTHNSIEKLKQSHQQAHPKA